MLRHDHAKSHQRNLRLHRTVLEEWRLVLSDWPRERLREVLLDEDEKRERPHT